MKTINFQGQTLDIELLDYQNGNLAIRLNEQNGFPFATLSINPGDPLPPNYFVLKEYSENAGVAKAFIEQAPVEDTGKHIQLGFVTARIFEWKG